MRTKPTEAGSVAAGPTNPAQSADLVRRETARLCSQYYGSRLRAVIVTGSLARDEATFTGDFAGRRLLGDAEFLLIFSDTADLPAEPDTSALSRRIESCLLSDHQLTGHIELSAGKAAYLARLTPHIFALELRECGRVIWGDSAILSLIPAFDASAIPLEDAWRLLANRMVEQLATVTEPGDGLPGQSLEAGYRTVKLYLDMATSFLLFTGAYAPTYRRRAENLRAFADRQESTDVWPFSLRDFADRVTLSTSLKLGISDAALLPGMLAEGHAGLLEWSDAVSCARGLWRWELERLGRTGPALGDRALMRRWMSAQPLSARMRGWIYVARRSGWWRSWRHWPRWVRYAWRGSPRYWVYASASELLFSLPALLASTTPPGPTAPDDLAAALPVPMPSAGDRGMTAWRRLAADILWNYERFLVGTRA